MELQDAKTYLRVETDDEAEDELIARTIVSAEKMCRDILRLDHDTEIEGPDFDMAVLYALAYIYEHREDADFGKLKKDLRDLLLSDRREVF